MLVGVPREIKDDENRVGLLPSGVEAFVHAGHTVLVETQAGAGIGFSDKDYREAGATIVTSPEEVYARAEMVVKVKEPLAGEYPHLRPGQILFTRCHFATSEPLMRACIESKAICIAYETVEAHDGIMPDTSTFAFTTAILTYALAIAEKGWKRALTDDFTLLRGLNIADGKVTFPALANEFCVEHHAPETLLA